MRGHHHESRVRARLVGGVRTPRAGQQYVGRRVARRADARAHFGPQCAKFHLNCTGLNASNSKFQTTTPEPMTRTPVVGSIPYTIDPN
jgi:hypothetical protein